MVGASQTDSPFMYNNTQHSTAHRVKKICTQPGHTQYTIHLKENNPNTFTLSIKRQKNLPNHFHQFLWEHSSHRSLDMIITVNMLWSKVWLGRGHSVSIKIIILHTPCEYFTWRRQDFCKQLVCVFVSLNINTNVITFYEQHRRVLTEGRSVMSCKLTYCTF